MILDIWTQLEYFFSTFASGLIVGIMFDIYRTIRGINAPNKVIAGISDILFWILQALIVFIFLIVTNNGELRYYTFVGILLGLTFYFKFMSKLIKIILIRIVMFISKIFSIIKNIILIPFKLVIYLFGYLCINIKNLIHSIHKSNKSHKGKEKQELKKEKPSFKENKVKRSIFKKIKKSG